MRVLITGGCGYLGSVLSLVLLRANHDIRVLDNLMYGFRFGWNLVGQDGFELIRGDLRDAAALSHALRDIDAVIHLAAIVGDPACARQPSLARAVNLDASINLLEVSRSAGVKHFIFASTCSN